MSACCACFVRDRRVYNRARSSQKYHRRRGRAEVPLAVQTRIALSEAMRGSHPDLPAELATFEEGTVSSSRCCFAEQVSAHRPTAKSRVGQGIGISGHDLWRPRWYTNRGQRAAQPGEWFSSGEPGLSLPPSDPYRKASFTSKLMLSWAPCVEHNVLSGGLLRLDGLPASLAAASQAVALDLDCLVCRSCGRNRRNACTLWQHMHLDTQRESYPMHPSAVCAKSICEHLK